MYAGMSSAMKPCGELMCSAYQLCLPHDMQCYPCESYCDKNSHNFDKYYCENQCKDYIDDKMSSNDFFVFTTFVSTTDYVWILLFAFIVFIMMAIKRYIKERYENPEVMIEDAIVKMSSGQAVTSIFKEENERD